MSLAYTPGLKIKASTVVRKERKLPLRGEIIVQLGDTVSIDQIVAKTDVPGDPESVNLLLQLGISDPEDCRAYLKKKEGDEVEEGEVIGIRKSFFGLWTTTCISPVKGTIELISDMTGMMIIKRPPIPVEVLAYIPGKVVEILPEEGVIIETYATYIQGILGIGGETYGEIMMIANSPSDIISAEQIGPECTGKILVGGCLIKLEGLRKAAEVGVKGVIVGGVPHEDLNQFIGRELGVAITGEEELGLTLILTEGFGKMEMSDKAFTLLKSADGKQASINGTTQIRAGVIRPEIIIPVEDDSELTMEQDYLSTGLHLGVNVRIIQDPYFGAIGKITSLPAELQQVETESSVRVTEIELEDGRKVIVPRANVEIIEE